MKFNQNVYINWFNQASYTFKSANHDLSSNDFSWCCFKCQQAVEFAYKAFIFGLGLPSFGHSVKKLAEIITNSIPTIKIDIQCLNELDRYYIPTRYADVYDDGSPFTYYTEKDALLALNCTKKLLHQIETQVEIILKKEQDEKAQTDQNQEETLSNDKKEEK